MLYFHGTNPQAARLIIQEGFRPGTWFSDNRPTAQAFGTVVFMIRSKHFKQFGWRNWCFYCGAEDGFAVMFKGRVRPQRILAVEVPESFQLLAEVSSSVASGVHKPV